MVLAHSATRGSRSSIVIPAYFMNICGPLRRRQVRIVEEVFPADAVRAGCGIDIGLAAFD